MNTPRIEQTLGASHGVIFFSFYFGASHSQDNQIHNRLESVNRGPEFRLCISQSLFNDPEIMLLPSLNLCDLRQAIPGICNFRFSRLAVSFASEIFDELIIANFYVAVKRFFRILRFLKLIILF